MVLTTWSRFALIALVMGCGAPEPVAGSQSEPSPVEGESSVVAPGAGGELDEAEGASGAGECARDSDCVEDACCHATGCVPRGSGPVCDDVVCSSECVTPLDCEATCVCRAGRCSVSES